MNRTRKIISSWLNKRFKDGEKIIVIEGELEVGKYEIKKIDNDWTCLKRLESSFFCYSNLEYVMWCLVNDDFKYKRLDGK